jgi:hypothetical protein
MNSPDVNSYLYAQIKHYWPQLKSFILSFFNFLVQNYQWLRLGVLLISGFILVLIIIVFRRGKKDFELFRNLTIRDILGLNSKKPIKYLDQWKKIEDLLKIKREKEMILAIIEARNLFNRLLYESGYREETFEGRLEKFKHVTGFKEVDDLLEVESLIKKIKLNDDFKIDYQSTDKIIKIYKKAISEELVVNIDNK